MTVLLRIEEGTQLELGTFGLAATIMAHNATTKTRDGNSGNNVQNLLSLA